MHGIRVGLILIFGLLTASCGGPGARQMTLAMLPGTSPSSTASNPPLQVICPPGNKDLFFAAPVCTGFQLAPGSSNPIVTAEIADASNAPAGEKVAFIAAALGDSREKCTDFIKQFTTEQAGQNSLLDTAGLVLSGIGAAITGPASTLRGLAAGSTAVQGFKQTINADFFQQMTIALFIQQINTTYFQVLDTQFPPAALSNMSASGALAAIQSIHRNCSIPFAAANLSTSSQKPPTPAGPTSFTLTGTAKPNDTYTLAGSSASTSLSVSLQASSGTGTPSATNMASQLAELAQANGSLLQAGVFASVTPNGTSATLTMRGGPSDIKWTLTASPTTAGITVKPSS